MSWSNLIKKVKLYIAATIEIENIHCNNHSTRLL